MFSHMLASSFEQEQKMATMNRSGTYASVGIFQRNITKHLPYTTRQRHFSREGILHSHSVRTSDVMSVF